MVKSFKDIKNYLYSKDWSLSIFSVLFWIVMHGFNYLICGDILSPKETIYVGITATIWLNKGLNLRNDFFWEMYRDGLEKMQNFYINHFDTPKE